jgi:hypothetical protein
MLTKDLPRHHQTSHIEVRGPSKKLNVLTRNTTPSWKRFGDGAKFVSFENRLPTEVNIIASETSYADKHKPNSVDVTKEVYLDLREDAARKLYEMLKEHFEPEAR